jgi:hypothetical protein
MPNLLTDLPDALDAAIAAAYLIGDHAATRFCALTAYLTLAFTIITGAAARKSVIEALRETD